MLPEPQNGPSGRCETAICLSVPLHIGPELRVPPIGIGLWCSRVLGASMPEASIDENHELLSGEYDVRLRATELRSREVHPISQATAMQLSAYGHLGRGVAVPDASHTR